MGEKPLIFPKYGKKTKVKVKSGHDEITGTVITISIALPGYMGRKPGTLIYAIKVESLNGNPLTGNLITTAGEEEISPIPTPAKLAK